MPTPSTSSPITTARPYRLLDATRGIASIWVVFFHAALLMSLYHPPIADIAWIKALFFHGFLGVQVFFVVSGYCIANAAVSALNKPAPLYLFTKARVRRILPPMWASLLLFAAASLLATWLVNTGRMASTSLARLDLLHQSPYFYLTNLTLTQLLFHQSFISEVCWTLCYEVAFYLLVALLLQATLLATRSSPPQPKSTRPASTMLTAAHLLTATCTLLLIAAPDLLPYPFDLWPQFGLGIAVFDALRPARSPASRVWLSITLILVTTFILCQNFPIGHSMQSSRLTFSTALIAALILFTCRQLDDRLAKTALFRFAAFIGDFSYSLYLLNFLLVSALMTLYRPLHLPAALDIPAIFLIVLLTLPPAYLFFILFEKPFISTRRTAHATAPVQPLPQSPDPTITTLSNPESKYQTPSAPVSPLSPLP